MVSEVPGVWQQQPMAAGTRFIVRIHLWWALLWPRGLLFDETIWCFFTQCRNQKNLHNAWTKNWLQRQQRTSNTPARTLFISGLKSRVMKLPFLSLKMMVKSGLEFILKLTEPLQSCCCPVQKYLPRLAELAWQLSRYLWRGSVNFKINSRPLFTIIFKLKNDNFKTRDFSPLIERVLTGVPGPCTYLLKSVINFGNRFYPKEKKPGWALLFWI